MLGLIKVYSKKKINLILILFEDTISPKEIINILLLNCNLKI
jgi:hypothetical protein